MIDRAREDEAWLPLMVAEVNLAVHVATVDLDEAVRLVARRCRPPRDHGLGRRRHPLRQPARLVLHGRATGTVVRQTVAELTASPVPLWLASFSAAGVTGLLRWAGADVPVPVELPDREYAGIYLGTQELAEGCVALGRGDAPAAVELLAVRDRAWSWRTSGSSTTCT